MDDDFMSLRNSGGSSSSSGDDLLGGFDNMSTSPARPTASVGGSGAGLGLEGFDMPAGGQPAAKKAGAKKKKKKARRRKPGMFLGMTAPQRMILSIFLFVAVTVLGCLVLFAVGAIQL